MVGFVRSNVPANRNRGICTAFTLVELLVVIGIIAVLVGILLPTLSRAREAANSAKCAANMRTVAQAMLSYANDFNGWLAGPRTSGTVWEPPGPNLDNAPNWGLDSIGPAETHLGTTPLQNVDSYSPTLGRMLKLPENDVERLKRLFEVDLFCPSNDLYFGNNIYNDEGVPWNNSDHRSNSYGTVIHFFAWPVRETAPATGYPPIIQRMTAANAVTYPPSYAPKITKVGNPSAKAFLTEASRFAETSASTSLNPSLTYLSMNFARYQIEGGNFMGGAPWAPLNGSVALPTTSTFNSNWIGKITPLARRLAWRHSARMNLAFFDGHVESRPVADTIKVNLYFPKGSVIARASGTYDPTDVNGQLID